MKRHTDISRLHPARRLFSTDTVEPPRRRVQDWALTLVGVIVWAVIDSFCQ